MIWESTLRKVDNGYICTTTNAEDEDLLSSLMENVFENPTDDDEGDMASFIAAVWHLVEYFGVLGSKHDEKRFWCGFIDRDGKPIES